MVLVLSGEDVASLVSLPDVAAEVERAQIKQDAGAAERPNRPHYPIGRGLDGNEPLGTGLAMPAYIHGSDHFATKLVSVHEGNPEGVPTLHSQLLLADARTGLPVSIMDANGVTNARTGCIGGLAARSLAVSPVDLAVIGAGVQARWQTRAVDALCDLRSVAIYAPSESKHAAADDLASEGIPASAAESAESAVRDANVVITATTSTEPVFPAEAVREGTLVVGIGAFRPEMQEIEPAVFDAAARVFADVPSEAIETGDLAATSLTADRLVPLGEAFTGETGRRADDEVLVVESVGSAVFDAATAEHVYGLARDRGVGTTVEL
ncbi:ornithine cyclodeaminase family protein [Halostella litorea]|uniref:ornithine cyclodeaminase family protein n=1 Tax=Halostella litorea TaxID=2528831 RepID=UPI001091B15B|nr:ornithine cyclodeaminase family protein [Halostella litorea]